MNGDERDGRDTGSRQSVGRDKTHASFAAGAQRQHISYASLDVTSDRDRGCDARPGGVARHVARSAAAVHVERDNAAPLPFANINNRKAHSFRCRTHEKTPGAEKSVRRKVARPGRGTARLPRSAPSITQQRAGIRKKKKRQPQSKRPARLFACIYISHAIWAASAAVGTSGKDRSCSERSMPRRPPSSRSTDYRGTM